MPLSPCYLGVPILDRYQFNTIQYIENSQPLLVSTHTSAGKTFVFEYSIAVSSKESQHVVYTTPFKVLSNQKYQEMYEQIQDVG